MMRRSSMHAVRSAGNAFMALGITIASSVAIAQDAPFGVNWPEGEGSALTGAWCGGCHSLNIVRQQGLTHEGWDELLVWMTEKQNMPPLQGQQRETVLDYLATNFGVGHAGTSTEGQQGDALAPLSPVQGISRPLLEIRPAEGSG